MLQSYMPEIEELRYYGQKKSRCSKPPAAALGPTVTAKGAKQTMKRWYGIAYVRIRKLAPSQALVQTSNHEEEIIFHRMAFS